MSSVGTGAEVGRRNVDVRLIEIPRALAACAYFKHLDFFFRRNPITRAPFIISVSACG